MPDNFEQELQNLIPLPPSETLESRIAAQIEDLPAPRPLADRLFLSTLTTALAASLFIAILLLTDNPSTSPTPLTHSPQFFTLADTPRLLTQLTPPDPLPSHAAPSTIPN